MNLQLTLKMIADKNRLRIINILKNNRLCVGEIQTLLGMEQSNTSRHLQKLKSNEIISSYNEAQRNFYYLNKNWIKKYHFLNDLIYSEELMDKQLKTDIMRLNNYLASNLSCEDLKKVNFDYNKIKF